MVWTQPCAPCERAARVSPVALLQVAWLCYRHCSLSCLKARKTSKKASSSAWRTPREGGTQRVGNLVTYQLQQYDKKVSLLPRFFYVTKMKNIHVFYSLETYWWTQYNINKLLMTYKLGFVCFFFRSTYWGVFQAYIITTTDKDV